VITDKPCAMAGLVSYRYKGRYGWIMIGAKDHADALREASRSTDDSIVIDNLQVWNGKEYVSAANHFHIQVDKPRSWTILYGIGE